MGGQRWYVRLRSAVHGTEAGGECKGVGKVGRSRVGRVGETGGGGAAAVGMELERTQNHWATVKVSSRMLLHPL